MSSCWVGNDLPEKNVKQTNWLNRSANESSHWSSKGRKHKVQTGIVSTIFLFWLSPKGISQLSSWTVRAGRGTWVDGNIPAVIQQPEEESLTCNSGDSKLGRALSWRRLRSWYRTQSERRRRDGQRKDARSFIFLERWHHDLFSVLSRNYGLSTLFHCQACKRAGTTKQSGWSCPVTVSLWGCSLLIVNEPGNM